MEITQKRLQIILKAVGSAKSPKYEIITKKINSRKDFVDNSITSEQIEIIHEVAKTIGNNNEAIEFIVRQASKNQTNDYNLLLKKPLADEQKKKIDTLFSTTAGCYESISEYTVIRKKYEVEIISEVNDYIKNGWIPYGGVSYAAAGMSVVGGNSFIQAMIKLNKEKLKSKI